MDQLIPDSRPIMIVSNVNTYHTAMCEGLVLYCSIHLYVCLHPKKSVMCAVSFQVQIAVQLSK